MNISKKNAALGENVTVNTKPNDGYEVDTVTVTDSKGNVIEVTKTADNEFSFVMPGSQVSVDVTFKEINGSPQKHLHRPAKTIGGLMMLQKMNGIMPR